MQSLDAIRTRFEDELSHSGLSEPDKMAARVRFDERMNAEQEARVTAIVENERTAQSSSPWRAAAGTAVAGGIKLADAATLGYMPLIVGALGGDKEKVEVGLEAMRRTNPIASVGGTIGGFVSKATPAGALSALAGKVGTAGVRGAFRGFGSKAFDEIAMRPFSQRAAMKFLENVTSGTGAVAATEAINGGDATIPQRLSNVVNSLAPTAILSAIVSPAIARYLRPVNAELKPIFARFKEITGHEISPDIATDSRELQAAIANIQRYPGMAEAVRQAKDRFLAGMGQIVREAGGRSGAVSNEAKAASAIERLQGSRANPSPITLARRGPEAEALAQYRGRTISDEAHTKLIDNVKDVLKDKNASDPRGGAMTSLLRDITKHGIRDLDTMEALRKRLGDIAFTMPITDPRFASRGRVEASRLYGVLENAIEQHAPEYSRALATAEKLRKMEGAMAEITPSNLDSKTVARFWSGDRPLERFEALRRFGTPEDVSVVKGGLFDALVRSATLADGSLSLAKLERSLSGRTMLSENVVETVLPGVTKELRAMAKIYERGRLGITRAEGSPTAGALMRAGNTVANTVGAAGSIASLFSNPYLVVGPLIGAAGVRWAIRQNLSRLLSGARADAMSRLGQGVAPDGLAGGAAAVNALGGMNGVGQAAAQSAGAAGQAVGQIIQTGARALGRGQEEPQ